MTRDDLAARVRFNLDDAGITYFSANDINDSLQDAYDEVVALAGTIETAANLPFVSDTIYYDVLATITDYMRPIAVKNDVTDRFLDLVIAENMNSFRLDWERGTGNSEVGAIIDHRWFAVFPHMITASGNMKFYYKASANTLSSATTPTIPTEHQTILEYYSTADLLEQMEEIEQASKYWQDYLDELEKLKVYMLRRSISDRIAQMNAQFFGRGIN